MPVHHSSRSHNGSHLMALAALVATWALVHVSLVAFGDLPVLDSGLMGPDSFMRMVRVTELAQHWQWFDTTIERANAPYGDVLHWTRPFDVLLLLLAQPLKLMVSGTEALRIAGIIVSPLVQLMTGLALIWALRPVIRPEVWFIPVVAIFLQPGILSYSVLGRADHHALLILTFVIVSGFVLRALRNPLDSRPALMAGFASGFGIWLSVEFLLPVAVCLSALGLPWLFGERERAGQNKWFALGMSMMLLAALFAERPLAHLLDPSYDKVSAVQYLLAVCVLLFWRTVESFENRVGSGARFLGRATLAVVGVGSLGLLFATIYPLFFAGPMVEVDPRIVPIWLDRVLEMLPLIPGDRDSLGRFIFYLGGVFLILPMFLKIVIDERHTGQCFAQIFILLVCAAMTAAALSHMRFSGYPEIGFVMAFAIVLDRFLAWTGRIGNDLPRGFLRGGFIALMLLGPILVGGALMNERAAATDASGQARNACDVGAMADYLEHNARWAGTSKTILTFMDIGPELLFRTRHNVIGTPYHRNGPGIYDGHRALATSEEADARAIVERRKVDLVLLCQSPAERAFYAPEDGKENLYQRLDRGDAPGWLVRVDLPETLAQEARLYRVIR